MQELMQDDDRRLFAWFASKPDSGQLVRDALREPPKVKFVSEWNKPLTDMKFPEGMPLDMKMRLINRRRQVMVYSYIHNGIGREVISASLFSRLCRELVELQAAWGHEFGFYDFQFAGFTEEKEDHLYTNLGIDKAVVDHAMTLLSARLKHERSLAA